MFTKQKHEVLHLNPHMENFLFHCLLSARKIQIKHIWLKVENYLDKWGQHSQNYYSRSSRKVAKIKSIHVVDVKYWLNLQTNQEIILVFCCEHTVLHLWLSRAS